MEDENKKARRNARREYLENVRELVAFVKKRDKRVARAQVRRTNLLSDTARGGSSRACPCTDRAFFL